jgi:hypothetical protein
MNCLGVKYRTKTWEAHEHDQKSGDNESITIELSQRLRKEGNTTINEVFVLRPGLEKVIEIVRISRCFESTETDLHIVENASCIYSTDTWLSKELH